MRLLKLFLFTVIFSGAASANALILSDVHTFDRPMINGDYIKILFNLTDHGYDHRTDTITYIKLSFDFREIIETEEDPAHWEDLVDWEPAVIYSWIFDGRDIYGDIDTGILSYATFWTKSNDCQFMPWESDVCEENLDLDGVMSSTIVAYNDNLWLGDVRLDVELTRIPEPTPVLLFGVGLLGLAVKQRSRNKKIGKTPS